MGELLLVGPKRRQGGPQDVDGYSEGANRKPVTSRFFEKHPLMAKGETLTAVFHGER